jgi:hypothetical protein
MSATWFDQNDPRCMVCGKTFDEVGGHLGGVLSPDGKSDWVVCIAHMTSQQRMEHGWALDLDDDDSDEE